MLPDYWFFVLQKNIILLLVNCRRSNKATKATNRTSTCKTSPKFVLEIPFPDFPPYPALSRPPPCQVCCRCGHMESDAWCHAWHGLAQGPSPSLRPLLADPSNIITHTCTRWSSPRHRSGHIYCTRSIVPRQSTNDVTRARYIFTQKDPTKYLCAGCLPQIDHSWDKRQRCRSLFYCLFPLKPLIIFLSSNKSGAQIKITNETRIYNYQFTISILQTCTCGSCYNNFQLNNHVDCLNYRFLSYRRHLLRIKSTSRGTVNRSNFY